MSQENTSTAITPDQAALRMLVSFLAALLLAVAELAEDLLEQHNINGRAPFTEYDYKIKGALESVS